MSDHRVESELYQLVNTNEDRLSVEVWWTLLWEEEGGGEGQHQQMSKSGSRHGSPILLARRARGQRSRP